MPHSHSLLSHHDRAAAHGQAADRRVGTQRTGADHDDLGSGYGTHAGFRHPAAGGSHPHPDAALPFPAAEPAVPAESAVPGGDVRHDIVGAVAITCVQAAALEADK